MQKDNVATYKLKGGMCSRESPLFAINNPVHYHDEHFELEIVTSGTGEMLFNDKTFSLNKGDIYLMRPSDQHGHTSNNLVFRQIETKEDILPQWIVKKAYALNNPVVAHTNQEEADTIIFLMILLEKELKSEKQYFENNSISLIELIYTYFFRLLEKEDIDSDKTVTKILYFLKHDNRFIQKITLDDIAKHVGYSKYYVSSLFHKKFGKTIQEYIIFLRLEYARKLLIQSNLSIAEIILEAGFSTSSNFYIQFNKTYGVSPLSFKKAINKTRTE